MKPEKKPKKQAMEKPDDSLSFIHAQVVLCKGSVPPTWARNGVCVREFPIDMRDDKGLPVISEVVCMTGPRKGSVGLIPCPIASPGAAEVLVLWGDKKQEKCARQDLRVTAIYSGGQRCAFGTTEYVLPTWTVPPQAYVETTRQTGMTREDFAKKLTENRAKIREQEDERELDTYFRRKKSARALLEANGVKTEIHRELVTVKTAAKTLKGEVVHVDLSSSMSKISSRQRMMRRMKRSKKKGPPNVR